MHLINGNYEIKEKKKESQSSGHLLLLFFTSVLALLTRIYIGALLYTLVEDTICCCKIDQNIDKLCFSFYPVTRRTPHRPQCCILSTISILESKARLSRYEGYRTISISRSPDSLVCLRDARIKQPRKNNEHHI